VSGFGTQAVEQVEGGSTGRVMRGVGGRVEKMAGLRGGGGGWRERSRETTKWGDTQGGTRPYGTPAPAYQRENAEGKRLSKLQDQNQTHRVQMVQRLGSAGSG
jgi:hypothetical protein